MKKLRNKRGETLVETLCAVLVTGLAVALLAAMVSTSSRLERKGVEEAGKLYSAVSNAESAAGTTETGTVKVKIGEEEKTVTVTFYGEQNQAVSYRKPTAEGTP